MGCGRGSSLAGAGIAAVALAFAVATACEKRALDEKDAGGGGLAGAIGLAGAAGAPGTGGAAAGPGAGGETAGPGAGGAAGDTSSGGRRACGVAGAGGWIGWQRPACLDGKDNDGDGKIDYDDPECLGGHDNDESSFAWGIPGDVDPCRLECFFDGNSGRGDDNCIWEIKCDPANNAAECPYDPAYATAHPAECSLSSSQTPTCVDRCSKLVPNGCDCFGCCTVPGLPGPVRLESYCTTADLGDPTKCPPCTQVTQCLNPCERCEFCVGKLTLPDDCAEPGGGAPYTCPAGATVCGAYGLGPECCPPDRTCVTGCCLPIYIIP
jgi:hypothetical protein